jgi:hypothetical protein
MRDIIASRRTRFEPSVHGFHFSNLRIEYSYGALQGYNLCGGMAYGSLDYFYHTQQIPQDRTPPAPGTALNTYIVDRQVHAHGFMIRTLPLRAAASSSDQFRQGLSTDGYFGGVMQWIDQDRPVPILMMSRESPLSKSSHWTVAIGYEMDEAPPDYGGRRCGRVILYDNNYPNEICYLEPDFAGQYFSHNRGDEYRSYWPNGDFQSLDPRRRPAPPRRDSSLPFY